uniref:CCHC-type domain-containing protein n=1 Tax=Neogobius melanostomus TaxID=47308 RepID=A0A8C6UCE1_9GOBI
MSTLQSCKSILSYPGCPPLPLPFYRDSNNDPSFLFQAVSSQGQLLGRHDTLLKAIMENQRASAAHIAQLGSMLENLTSSMAQSAAAAASPPPPSSHVPDPEHYSGDMGKCGAFLLQCSLVFSQKPVTYASDSSKIAFVMGLLQDKALAWASTVWQNTPDIRHDYEHFEAELKKVFDHPVQGKEAARRMLALHQGTRSAAEYSVEFRTLAAEAGWDDAALMSVFTNGLSEQLKDELAVKDEYEDLDSLISAAIRLDNRIRERRRDRSLSVPHPSLSQPRSSDEEPMQLSRTHLTPTERSRRIRSGECIYCGQFGHFLAACPVRPKGGAHQ